MTIEAARRTALVLLVEDEPEFANLVSLWLEQHGWESVVVSDGTEALQRFDSERPDVVLLDVSVPGMNGWEVLDRIRATSDTPVLMVTARGAEADRLRGLSNGADDYITKPFSFPELIARVEVALRRAEGVARASATVIRHGDLAIESEGRRVVAGRRELHLTPTEFQLLSYLAHHPGRVISHRELLVAVWGRGYEDEHHLLQVAVRNLRTKLDPGNRSRYISTVYGTGYRLSEP
jgi:DNA-binding response OmpR family regulator